MSGVVVLIIRILMALALYGFIFWAVYTLWKDLQLQSQALATKKIPPLLIYPLDYLDSTPVRFEIPEVILGRDPACSFVVADETVSARHTRFSYNQNQWWIEDLHSTNGTYLNEEPINTLTVIVSGDEIRCGQAAFRVEIPKSS
jgi:pSer/pThr/pTyr-binding forkhead associated (FHA) protein